MSYSLQKLAAGKATIANVCRPARSRSIDFDSLIMVTSREPCDELYQELLAGPGVFKSLRAIGDCHAPSTVAAAVYDGHSAARYLDSCEDPYAPLFRREMPTLDQS